MNGKCTARTYNDSFENDYVNPMDKDWKSMDANEQAQQPPRRRSCLGCVVKLFFISVVFCLIAAVGLYFLVRHAVRDEPAWQHLPAGTEFALEMVNVPQLARPLLADPDVIAWIAQSVTSANKQIDENDLRAALAGGGDYGSWFLPSRIIAADPGGDQPLYYLALLPWWQRFFVWTAARSSVVKYDDDLYGTYIGGWTAIAQSPEILEILRDNWSAAAAPLGQGIGDDAQAGIHVVQRSMVALPVAGQTAAPAASAPGIGMGLALADPFAAARQPQNIDTMHDIDVWIAPGPAPTRHAVAAEMALTPALWAQGVETLRAKIPDSGQTHALVEALLDALAAGTGRAVLTADPPAKNADPDMAPLPVCGLQWELSDTAVPSRLNNAIKTAVQTLHTDLTRSANEAVRTTMDKIRIEDLDSGQGCVVRLPVVAANCADPAWQISSAGACFATDPKGIADPKFSLAVPEADTNRLELRWNTTKQFIDAARAVVADRLNMLPGMEETENPDVHKWLRQMAQALRYWPRGSITVSATPAPEK